MKGKIEFEIYNKRVRYKFALKRNITIIQGNSATGKTELIRMLADYENNGSSSGITLMCSKKCTVLENRSWQDRLTSLSQCIVFIDENSTFITSKEFARAIKGSDNYFVIITREALEQLPYSIEEIYTMTVSRESQKYKSTKQIYNELSPLYDLQIDKEFKPTCIITEDSGSGYDFFNKVFTMTCVSSKGKSNVLRQLQGCEENEILTIVDGAAFGSEMSRVIRYMNDSEKRIMLYSPESFEYLLLKANLIDHTSKVTDNTYDYVDSKLFFSWEEFYTDYLMKQTDGTVYRYSKSKLNDTYLSAGNRKKIISIFPVQIKSFVEIESL